jgi:hypothetical protein
MSQSAAEWLLTHRFWITEYRQVLPASTARGPKEVLRRVFARD